MEKINYQKILDGVIAENERQGRVPSLLLHSCCAPCSSYVLEYLNRYFDITVFYYNPNIYPAEEFYRRREEQQRFIERFPAQRPIGFMGTEHGSEEFYRAVKGLESEPEGGARCERCFRLRLTAAARAARNMGADYFTTTLSISPHKDAQLLNLIGGEIGGGTGVPYLYSDFKKKNGFKRSVELSREYEIYRQDYCGCAFSCKRLEVRG